MELQRYRQAVDLSLIHIFTFGNNLTQWNIAGGVHLVGLFDRRMAEARLFSSCLLYTSYNLIGKKC